MLDERRRRWAGVVQMLYKCFVFAGKPMKQQSKKVKTFFCEVKRRMIPHTCPLHMHGMWDPSLCYGTANNQSRVHTWSIQTQLKPQWHIVCLAVLTVFQLVWEYTFSISENVLVDIVFSFIE